MGGGGRGHRRRAGVGRGPSAKAQAPLPVFPPPPPPAPSFPPAPPPAPPPEPTIAPAAVPSPASPAGISASEEPVQPVRTPLGNTADELASVAEAPGVDGESRTTPSAAVPAVPVPRRPAAVVHHHAIARWALGLGAASLVVNALALGAFLESRSRARAGRVRLKDQVESPAM